MARERHERDRPRRHDGDGVVRMYFTVRSAHLERAARYGPATLLFAHRNYDFDAGRAAGLDLVGGSLARRLGVLVRRRPRILEINEPLMRPGLLEAAAAVLAVRLLTRRTLVVTYAIENRDPFGERAAGGLKPLLRHRAESAAAHFVARRLDRIVYGTDGAAQLYRRRLGSRLRAEQQSVPALPAPCGCATSRRPDELGSGDTPGRAVLFVGAFSARKGVAQLLDAWPEVHARRPEATLTLVGTGPLLEDVRVFADAHPEVTLLVDPPRDRVHAEQRAADVAVLLSQRTPTWREQVGLPIVEGLAHGCRVVTTDETGLADWLSARGHEVLPAAADRDAIADAVVRALADVDPAGVLAALPGDDGRDEAERRLTR